MTASSSSLPNHARFLQQTRLGSYFWADSITLLRTALGKKLENNVQLILTSPPFPLNHKKSYGNLCGNGYQEWFSALAPVCANLLTPSGQVLRPYSPSMKQLFRHGRYNNGKRPSEHTISETGFLSRHKGSIPPNVFELEPMQPGRTVRLPNAFSLANTASNAGFKAPKDFKVKFSGEKDINALVRPDGTLDPSKGIPLDEASDWFTAVWENYDSADYFIKYRQKKGREWADEDLKALMIFLTKKSKPGGNPDISGFIKLRNISKLHTDTVGKPFETEILEELRKGKIIIVDLSQGDPAIQSLYSDSICRKIFSEAMGRFIENKPNNFLQFYFEEAHNLFPKKDDKDLSLIYNRLAKEGAKLNLGLIYATQEVSSISSNILKNTQNWFIAHLNNEEETREIKKYYDFEDFTDGLVRFSANSDKGFVRMKTYSNPFVVPVQIDRFLAGDKE